MSTALAVLYIALLVFLSANLIFVGLIVLGRTLAGIRKIRRDRAWLRARAERKRRAAIRAQVRAEIAAGLRRYEAELAVRRGTATKYPDGTLRYSPGMTVRPGEAVVIPISYVTWPDQ